MTKNSSPGSVLRQQKGALRPKGGVVEGGGVDLLQTATHQGRYAARSRGKLKPLSYARN